MTVYALVFKLAILFKISWLPSYIFECNRVGFETFQCEAHKR